jgi:parvulin-like peptidyl-prolyl isomerase
MAVRRASAITLAALLVCAAWTGSARAQGFAAGPAAAVVNGEKIPAADVQKLLQREPPTVHPLTQKQKQELWQLALDMLINDVLMRQFLTKNTPAVSTEQIAKEMDLLKTGLAKQNMTLDKFLKDSDQTPDELKDEITVRLQWRAYVTNRLPEPMCKKYYDANKVFFDKVFVRASHILLKVPENATAATKQTVKDKLTQLRQEVLAGKITFENAAKKYSDCVASKDKGGDIGHFPFKFAVTEPFAAAAFGTKVGDISDLIETEFGFHIVKVTERTPGQASKYEDIVDLVRDVYAQDLQLFQSIIHEQRKTAKIEVFPPQ